MRIRRLREVYDAAQKEPRPPAATAPVAGPASSLLERLRAWTWHRDALAQLAAARRDIADRAQRLALRRADLTARMEREAAAREAVKASAARVASGVEADGKGAKEEAVKSLFVVFGLPGQATTVLGLAGAGLTVALKDFIVAFFGWFILMGRNGIRTGDWVEIKGVGGEVVEIGLFHTVLLETGSWSDAGHPTGRRVSFVNSFAAARSRRTWNAQVLKTTHGSTASSDAERALARAARSRDAVLRAARTCTKPSLSGSHAATSASARGVGRELTLDDRLALTTALFEVLQERGELVAVGLHRVRPPMAAELLQLIEAAREDRQALIFWNGPDGEAARRRHRRDDRDHRCGYEAYPYPA